MHSTSRTHPGQWSLRRASKCDGEAIHKLLGEPLVYRYLCDGVPPARTFTDEWLELNTGATPDTVTGLWLLLLDRRDTAGCIALKALEPGVAELTSLLHPRFWGRGLATRMAWTVMERAFRNGLERVVAGADAPNCASIKVMQRLEMRYVRHVTYPLGPGVEYERLAGDPVPTPRPDLIPFQWD